jgi:F420H(2)-dependent quinone reductase
MRSTLIAMRAGQRCGEWCRPHHPHPSAKQFSVPTFAQVTETEYAPSPTESVRLQVEQYEATNGVEGGTLEGKPVVILTTVGAKSGKIRKTPLMRVEQNGTYVAVASAGGSPQTPAWYFNLLAQPEVMLQDGARRTTMRAREVTGAEKERWWAVADAAWPLFPSYRQKAGREIPVLVLEPVN